MTRARERGWRRSPEARWQSLARSTQTLPRNGGTATRGRLSPAALPPTVIDAAPAAVLASTPRFIRAWSALANHNAALPKETLKKTSGYTELVALDESTLLVIYDRIPFGWGAIPADSTETNSCWVVRLKIKRDAR